MNKNINLEKYHKELIKVSRNQLLKYPEQSIKQKIKSIIKSLLKRQLSFKTDRYFWPNGLLAISLEYSHRLTNDRKDIKYLERYFNNWIKDGTRIINADYATNGYALIYLYNIKKRKKYLKIINQLAQYILSLEKAKDGSIPYRENNGDKIYVDLIGLTCPFLARYYNFKKDEEALDLCIFQLKNYLSYGMCHVTELPYHAYSADTGTKLGIIGWGRGVAWLLIGLVDSLEYIPENHKDYKYLKESLQRLVETVLTYQNKSGGYNWQLQARDGHFDSSATSMIGYALMKGIMLGFISLTYLENVNKDIKALYTVSTNGVVKHSSAECRGLGMYPQRYENNPWSQGPTTSLVSLLLLNQDKIGLNEF